MLEKEMSRAARLAEEANKRVDKLRDTLISETEKAHKKMQRELTSARGKHEAASKRLQTARASLRKKATPSRERKVDDLVTQMQELADSVADIARAAYHYAEKLMPLRADLALETSRARAAEEAAKMAEKASARHKRDGGAGTPDKPPRKKPGPKPGSKRKAPAAGKAVAKKPATKGKKAAAGKAGARKAAAGAAPRKSAAKKAPAKKAASSGAPAGKRAPAKKRAPRKAAPKAASSTPEA